ncbi:MAG: aspartate kinase [Chitinophagales bacterium]
MKVFKFGGASIKDAESIKNVCEIIKKYGDKTLLVVVSASGKTTNALEDVTNAYFKDSGKANDLLDGIKQNHFGICKELFDEGHKVYDDLQNIFVELEWQLEEERLESYNYVYDQIVSVGELLSTTIISHYLNEKGILSHWLDVRDVLKTDDTYREAKIDWEQTDRLIKSEVIPLLKDKIVITQGFLGCTPENCTTTLGREGSDFTAAIFANALDAESQSVWKDVPGILNGDPRIWEETELIEDMTYHEAIEMTFYGAQVIHPKTIKPLQNKQIPLLVRSFIHPEDRGTKIYNPIKEPIYPPVRVIKYNQALISLYTKDFSFIEEYVMSKIIKAFSKVNLKINMMQNAAILFQAVVDNSTPKLEALVQDLERFFDIQIDKNLTLLTVRHYNDGVIKKSIGEKNAILEQKRATTYQALLK